MGDARLAVLVLVEQDNPHPLGLLVEEDEALSLDVERLDVTPALVDELRCLGHMLEQHVWRFVGQGRCYRAEKDQEHRPAEYFEHGSLLLKRFQVTDHVPRDEGVEPVLSNVRG